MRDKVYKLKTFEGDELIITPKQAGDIAEVASLIEVTDVFGRIHFINKSSISLIDKHTWTSDHEYGLYLNSQDNKQLEAGNK